MDSSGGNKATRSELIKKETAAVAANTTVYIMKTKKM
jgi:hypothetical protein